MRSLLVFSLALVGCAGPLETAERSRTRSPDEVEHCRRLDRGHRNWSASAKGASVAAGASGISTIPIETDAGRIAVAAAGVAAATWAVISSAQADAFAASWARECGGD